MPKLDTLVTRFSKVARGGETIEAAAARARAFVDAALKAGLDEELTDALREPKLVEADALDDVAAAAKGFDDARAEAADDEPERAIDAAETRFGEPLPATLRELWTFVAHPARARFVRGVLKHALVTPDLLVAPSDWTTPTRLSCINEPDSLSDVRERFENEYEEWFADAEADTKVSKPADLDDHEVDAMLMLDPALKESIIPVAYWHGETWFVLHDLRSTSAPAPVFSINDEDEGYARYVAPDVRGWFSWAVSEGIKSCVEEE